MEDFKLGDLTPRTFSLRNLLIIVSNSHNIAVIHLLSFRLRVSSCYRVVRGLRLHNIEITQRLSDQIALLSEIVEGCRKTKGIA